MSKFDMLKESLFEAQKENERLESENESLRQQLADMARQCNGWKKRYEDLYDDTIRPLTLKGAEGARARALDNLVVHSDPAD